MRAAFLRGNGRHRRWRRSRRFLELGSDQLLVSAAAHQLRTDAHGLRRGLGVAEALRFGHDTGQKRRSNLRINKGLVQGVHQLDAQFAQAAGVGIQPIDAAQLFPAPGLGVQGDNGGVVQDAAVRGDGQVQLLLFVHAQRHHDIDIEVALAEFEVFVGDRGTVRGNKNLDHAVLDLVAQLVGLGLVERDDEIAQAVGVFLDGFFGLQKLQRGRHITAKDGCGMLAHLVQADRKSDASGKLVHRGVIAHRDQYVISLLYAVRGLL